MTKYGVIYRNGKALCIPQFSSIIVWWDNNQFITDSLIKFVESSSNIVPPSIEVSKSIAKHGKQLCEAKITALLYFGLLSSVSLQT